MYICLRSSLPFQAVHVAADGDVTKRQLLLTSLHQSAWPGQDLLKRAATRLAAEATAAAAALPFDFLPLAPPPLALLRRDAPDPAPAPASSCPVTLLGMTVTQTGATSRPSHDSTV